MFLEKFQTHRWLTWVGLLACCWLLGCSTADFPVPSFVSRLNSGDQHIGWAVTYLDSWRRARQPRYLMLAEKHAVSAVDAFARLQVDTSPRINEFYVARERRVRSCRLLAELQFEAANFGYNLQQDPVAGCLF